MKRSQPVVFWGTVVILENDMLKNMEAGANLAWSNKPINKIPKLNRKKAEMLETLLINREIVDSEVGEFGKDQVT